MEHTTIGRVKRPSSPAWIHWLGPDVRWPFRESGWAYVMEVCFLGFRADRHGRAVVISGKPGIWETEAI